MKKRTIEIIAQEIRADWKNPYFGAVPYLDAMGSDDYYGCDSAVSIISYFLANASTWRGQKAREIKKELNLLIK